MLANKTTRKEGKSWKSCPSRSSRLHGANRLSVIFCLYYWWFISFSWFGFQNFLVSWIWLESGRQVSSRWILESTSISWLYFYASDSLSPLSSSIFFVNLVCNVHQEIFTHPCSYVVNSNTLLNRATHLLLGLLRVGLGVLWVDEKMGKVRIRTNPGDALRKFQREWCDLHDVYILKQLEAIASRRSACR